MKSSTNDKPHSPGQAPLKTRRFGVSLVWIVPIIAVLVGISLVVHSILQEGPTITLTFKAGDGLITLIFMYCTIAELARVIGRDRLKMMFVGPLPPIQR